MTRDELKRVKVMELLLSGSMTHLEAGESVKISEKKLSSTPKSKEETVR